MSGKRVRKKEKKGFSALKFIFNMFLAIFLIALVVGTGVMAGMYVAVSQEMKDLDIKSLAQNTASVIYREDENGNFKEIGNLPYSNSIQMWIDSEHIPQLMKDAVVSIEDERFYKHFGVDVKRTTGAFINWCMAKVGLSHSSYGGSTITQQVIKNITKEDDKKVSRKIKEMLRAIALEREMSKDEILTIYLNIVFFANNCDGVQAASYVYYNKDINDLTLAQIASIAGITQRPSNFDPFKHPDNNTEKRNVVLKKMYELGKITKSEYDNAVSEDISVTNEYKSNQGGVSSYFVDQVINDVMADLQEKKGYSESYAKQLIYGGGLKIYTTMDQNIQTDIEEVFTNTGNFPKTTGGKTAQSAMIVLDPYTGAVKGLVGGLGKKTESRGLIRTSQIKRQPGSSIKPLSVYTPAIEENKINAATLVKDEEYTSPDGKWSPKNSYSGFKGDITVRTALEISSNLAAVNTLDKELGINSSFSFLKNRFEFSAISDNDRNLSSLALGGLTNGVSPEEMAAAYAVFVNGGNYITPYTYTKVLDASDKILLENDSTQKKKIISSSTAYIMADLLYSVVNGSSGTGKNAKLDNMPTYGKTGTTNDDKDRWFVGFTPYYVAAVWYGFDSPSSIKEAGVTYNPSTKAWHDVMQKIHSNLPSKQLLIPSDIVAEEICTITGKIAGSKCSSHTEYFSIADKPKEVCSSKHQGEKSDTSSKSEDDIIGESYTSAHTLEPKTSPHPDSSNAATLDPKDNQNNNKTPSSAQASHTKVPVSTDTNTAKPVPAKTMAPENPVQTHRPDSEVLTTPIPKSGGSDSKQNNSENERNSTIIDFDSIGNNN